MSKPFPRTTADRPAQAKVAPLEAQSTEMYVLAKHLSEDGDHPRYDNWDEQLTNLVRRCVKSGRDDIIDAALQKALDADDEGAREELDFTAEAEVQGQQVAITPTGKPVFSFLLASPVILSDVTRLKNGKIPPSEQFDALTKSLRGSGLLGDGPSVALLNYLYHPYELVALGWSDLARLNVALGQATAVNGRIPADLKILGQDSARFPTLDESSGPLTGLRYLVWAVADTVGPHHTPLLAPNNAKKFQKWLGKMEAWQKTASSLLEQALGKPYKGAKATVTYVAEYFTGYREGVSTLRMVQIYADIARILNTTGVSPSNLSAVLALYEAKDGEQSVKASLISKLDNSLLDVISCEVSSASDAVEVFECLSKCLHTTGIADIEATNDLVPETKCSGCGVPMYLVPAEEGDELVFTHIGDAAAVTAEDRGQMLH